MAIDAGTIYSEIRIQLDKLKQDIAKVEANFDKFGKMNANQATTTQKKWTNSFNQINLVAVAAFAGIAIAVKNAVKTFASFEQALANVQSVAQATSEELKAIEEAALVAGETTRFTATQAAEAMYSLASAGFDAQQSIDALNGVLLLAGATQSDLSMTSRTLAATIAQFNLEAEDAADVANIFTAAITNSQATMDKLAVSLSYVGPVASAMNKSLEETTGVLQILFNQGFKASQAGTALRSALADLSNEASPAVAKLKKLGVSFDEINTSTNSFAEIFEVLNEKVTEGGDIMSIFGDRAGPAMIKLIQGGREEIEKYTAAVTDTNAAAEAYAIQNDTLQGSLDFLKSAIESAQIQFVKEFSPAIRGVVDLITGFVKIISGLPKPLKLFFSIVAVGIPSILAMTTAIKFLSGALAGAAGPVSIIVTALSGIVAFSAAISDSFDTVGNSTEELTETTNKLRKSNEELSKINKELETSTSDLNSVERITLKQREEMAKSTILYNLASQIKAIKNAKKARDELNETLEKEKELFKLVTNIADVDSDKWVEYRGELVRAGAIQVSQLHAMAESGKKIEGYQKDYDVLNQTVKDGTDAILESIEAGNLTIDQVSQLNKWLGEQLKLRLTARKVNKNIAEEEENQAKKELENANKKIEKEKELSDKEKKAREEKTKATNKLIEETGKYNDKLEDLRASTLELIDLEHQRARESIQASKADGEAKIKALQAVDAYYEALKDKTASEEFKKNMKTVIDSSLSGFSNLISSLSSLSSAMTENRLAELDRQLQAELEAAGVAEERTIERLQRELLEAREAGDESVIIEKEDELKKAKITEEFEKKKAQVAYEGEKARWQLTMIGALAESARAIIQAWNSAPWPWNIPAVGFTTFATGAQVAAIGESQPQPPKFEYGGIVDGEQYSTDNVNARVGSREMILNKEQQARLFDIANGGNRSPDKRMLTFMLYMDMQKVAEGAAEYYEGGVVKLKI